MLNKVSDKKIVIVDSKNVLYRMHFSHRTLATKDGISTGAMFGFWNEILRIQKKWPGACIVFCWDGMGRGWRHEVHAGYKGNRIASPDTQLVQEQEAPMRKILEAMGFWSLWVKGVEADDLIGILTGVWDGEHEVRVYSGDKDMFQLVGNTVTVWQKWMLPPLNQLDVFKIMGVLPRDVTEVRAMVGDPADNLKGLFKVGPKKAVQLWKAGVRASRTWEKQSPAAKVAAAKWQGDWSRLNMEYSLVKIPRLVDQLREGKEDVAKMVQKIAKHPERLDMELASEEWVRFLGRYEFKDLWKDRNAVWLIP